MGMAKYTFLDLAEEVLQASEVALAPLEIWKRAVESGFSEKLKTQGKTPWVSLASRLYVDTKDNPSTRFVRLGESPVLFGLKGAGHQLKKVEDILENGDGFRGGSKGIKERDLHPFLAYFSFFYLDRVYVKTIYHEKSLKKSFSEWMHPDLVGVRFPETGDGALELARTTGSLPIRLFSFELKICLSFSNLREAFFQAVSNSSWASYGYLVAAEISDDQEFRSELRRLSDAFGIGVIRLDLESPDDSSVVFQAREREALDWHFINKLSHLNEGFARFLNDVKIDIDGKKIHKTEYDDVEEDVDQLKIKLGPQGKK